MSIINTQIDLPYQADIDVERLTSLAKSALEYCRIDDGEVTVVISSDDVLRSLNRQYRGVDAPTDVLSFEEASPADEFVLPGQESPYLGDVIISAPTAIKQAQAMGHAPFEEILLLTVHGILHLLGFDHLTPAEKVTMWQKQEEILRLNNLSHVQPTEEPGSRGVGEQGKH